MVGFNLVQNSVQLNLDWKMVGFNSVQNSLQFTVTVQNSVQFSVQLYSLVYIGNWLDLIQYKTVYSYRQCTVYSTVENGWI